MAKRKRSGGSSRSKKRKKAAPKGDAPSSAAAPEPADGGPSPADVKTAAATPHTYKPGSLTKGMLCLVKETPVVRQRHPDIHGCRCNIVEVPRHPNTWYQVQVHNAPVTPKNSKYNTPIKVQAPSLIPISEDGMPILGDAAEELASAPKSKQDSASSKSKSKAGKSRDSQVDSTPSSDGTGLVESYPNISGKRRNYQNGKGSEAGVFLSKTEPSTHWIGRRVLVKVGKTSDTEALVVGSGKGWVQLVYAFPNGSPEGPAGEHPKDCAKRAHELKCKYAAPHAFDDPTFNGGKFAATGEYKGEVTITSGRFKKRKGKVIGGGHGYYLVELRDQTTLLKTEDQLEAAALPDLSRGKQGKGGVAPAAEDNGSAGEANGAVALVVDSEGGASAAENGGAGGGAGGSAASSSSSSSSSTSGKRDRGSKKRSTKSSDKAAAKVSDAVPNAAAGRPRRANAGVNKSRHSMPGTTSNKYSRRYGTAPDGGDEDSDGEHTRTGPMTPAEKLAHRNKEKIKAKFRAVQNAVLKRSKRSTRGSRYSQSTKRHYSAGLSEREREEEEARAHYEMQVESYQQRVQKYVEIAIERERNEPRPDVTAAMILIERDWKHDGLSDNEDGPTHEWEVNDPEVYDLEPERREWESMGSAAMNKAFAEDEETARAIEIFSKKAEVKWLGTASDNVGVGGAAASVERAPVYNKMSDWQTSEADDDMCAYDYIQARFRGGIHLFAPKSAQPSRGQFARKRTRLEPAPAYGHSLP